MEIVKKLEGRLEWRPNEKDFDLVRAWRGTPVRV